MAHDSEDLIDRMAALKAERRPFVLATVIRTEGASAIKAGSKALIRDDGQVEGWLGGACSDSAIKTAATDALNDGLPRSIRITAAAPTALPAEAGPQFDPMREFKSGCQSGGVIEVFIEPVLPRPALYLLGDSPAADALAELGVFMGFAVTRAYPGCPGGLDSFDLIGEPNLQRASIVVATQGRRDTAALEAALATPAPYVAFIGSRRKAERLKIRLAEQGISQDRLSQLRAPAGLDLGGRGPREIALSILAEIVQVRAAETKANKAGAQASSA